MQVTSIYNQVIFKSIITRLHSIPKRRHFVALKKRMNPKNEKFLIFKNIYLLIIWATMSRSATTKNQFAKDISSRTAIVNLRSSQCISQLMASQHKNDANQYNFHFGRKTQTGMFRVYVRSFYIIWVPCSDPRCLCLMV